MKHLNRRDFMKRSLAAGAAASTFIPFSRVRGANNDIRVAVVGFRGHGMTHINSYLKIAGVRVVALCEADESILNRELKNFAKRKQKVDAYADLRKMLEDENIDAVSTATPNHWHSLVTVWACQAGKDVCVEKPVSHNIFEGRKMVEAARKYNRMVQADLDNRSNEGVHQAIRYVQQGNLGKIEVVRGFCYKRRRSIGKVSGPQPIPKSVNYDLWCGPASKGPLMRKNLHYDWHWVWETGCGEIGNNGPHQLDLCRYVVNADDLPRRVMSIGGRFGYDDDAETPNTQIAVFEYDLAPIIYEVRGLPRYTGDNNMDSFQAVSQSGQKIKSGNVSPSPTTGVVVQCEGGYLDIRGLVAYDKKGNLIKQFKRQSIGPQANFIKAVRSRKISDLRTDILQGHLSTCLCHMGNISHRVGKETPAGQIRERIQQDKDALEAYGRFQEHLAANGVNLKKTPPALGPWLTMDSKQERFTGPFADQANRYISRNYRKPFVVPEQV
jgi:predicted dehydrogenase